MATAIIAPNGPPNGPPTDANVISVPDDAVDSSALRALKSRQWTCGRALTAFVQDLALRDGKRAMVATSGGSFKKFVCASETPCRWLVNAVRTRPRARKPRVEGVDENDGQRKYWYVSSAYLVHTNCTGMAKPTARQLKDVTALQTALQHDATISSTALVEQLKREARLVCSKSMVYKAKMDVLDALEAQEESTETTAEPSDVVVSTQRLPSFLARLSSGNPGVLHTIERDPTAHAHFHRAVVALNPVRLCVNAMPLVFGVDTRKGTSSRGGAQLVLVGCDANLETVTLATALVPEPSEEHVSWFLIKLIDCGYPLQRANGVYCDGRWPISSACARVGIQGLIQDTRAVIDDLHQVIAQQFAAYQPSQAPPVLGPDHLACIWTAQRAESEGEFYAALHKLEMVTSSALNASSAGAGVHLTPDAGILAAQHLRALDPRRWALFPRFSTARLYGWQTTKVSHDQHSALQHLSCEFFKAFATTLRTESLQRHERAVQWEREQRVVTPAAERLMQEEMKLVPLYDVAMSAPHIAFVWNPHDAPQLRQCRVDLQAKSCMCAVHLQFGVPCRHILSVLRKLNALGQSFDYFDDSLRVRGFVDAHKGQQIELPLDETIEMDKTWLPAKSTTPSGGSVGAVGEFHATLTGSVPTPLSSAASVRKRRVRNKPADERKRPLYKCRKCNVADGHNSMTCPSRRAKTSA